MSTIVHFECRNPDHRRGGSRRGVGGLVIRHGSVGYCDGLNVDGAHRWIPTGGVPLEALYAVWPNERPANTERLTLRPSTGGSDRDAAEQAPTVEVMGGERSARPRISVKPLALVGDD